MLEVLTRYWWAVVLRGAAALIFGLVALIWPQITLLALVIVFGAYAVVDGVLALGSAITGGRTIVGSRGWLAVEGALGIIAGVVAFVWPGITALVLLWLIGFWALVTGILEIVAAVRLRREIRGEWMLVLSGALSVLFGILLLVWPASGALAVVFLIGLYAILFGVAFVVLGLRLRRLRQHGATTATPGPAPA
jgi:uncharacterized membrane protein HdeD (DUF308 family)